MRKARKSQAGMSLLEMLVAMALTVLIMASIFAQIIDGQQTSSAEAAKLDLFGEARVFMDQMARDLRSAGYPNTHNYSTPQNPNSTTTAVGLVYLGPSDLWFEASIDGSAQVYLIQYHLDNTCTPLPCLRRAQTPKITGDPYTNAQAQLTNYQTEVQNVQNGSSTDPIFRAYAIDATEVTLPINLTDDAATIANINSVAVRLTVQSPYPEQKTKQFPTMTLLSTVRLHNCSGSFTEGGHSVMGC